NFKPWLHHRVENRQAPRCRAWAIGVWKWLGVTAVWLVLFGNVFAQSVRFYPTPYQVSDGASVQFHYVDDTNTIPRTNILSWSWDFNNDGVVDASGDSADGIDA